MAAYGGGIMKGLSPELKSRSEASVQAFVYGVISLHQFLEEQKEIAELLTGKES